MNLIAALIPAILATCLISAANAAQYSFAIFSPAAGAVWYALQTNNITWNNALSGVQNFTLSIHLVTVFPDPAQPLTDYILAAEVPYTAGIFTWTVPPEVPPNQNYMLQLYDSTKSLVGLGPIFSIGSVMVTPVGTSTPTVIATSLSSWGPPSANTVALTGARPSITIITLTGTGSPAIAVGPAGNSGAGRTVRIGGWWWVGAIVGAVVVWGMQ